MLDYGVSTIEVHRALPGTTSNQPSVDALNKRMSIKYNKAGNAWYAVFNLADVIARNYTPLYNFPRVGVAEDEVFQGSCLFGDYIYQLTGTNYTSESGANPPSGHGNTHVTCIDVRTGALVQRSRTEAAYSLSFREPEGIGVVPASGSTPARLFMGFAGGAEGNRNATLYYKPGTA